MKYFLSTPLFLVVFCCLGCSGGYKVSGTVTFPDGKPLTSGRVVFDSETRTYAGELNSSGKYTLAGNDGKGGIPSGHYAVSIQGAEQSVARSDNPDAPPIPLIHANLTRKATSNLTCDVNGSTVFDIPVHAP